MLQYIPAPNTAGGVFATSAYNQTLRDDKGAIRIDGNTRLGLLSAYYFIDDFDLDNPYPTAQSGASVPGFNALTTGRAQLLSLGDTKTFGASTVNEFHLSYMRDFNNLGQPVGGRGVSLVSQGFANADGSPSIVALDPKGQSVENLNFNGFSTGAAANQLTQANNTYEVTDDFSKVLGSHTIKFGGESHLDQVNVHPIAQFNGSFVFSGTETGVDFADFLIGVPSQYNQSQLNPFYDRNKYFGVFAQDSWHILAEPHAELRPALGSHRTVDREVQPDLDLRCRCPVGRLSWRASGHPLPGRSRRAGYPFADQQSQLCPSRRTGLVAAGIFWKLAEKASRRSGNN